MKKHNSEEMEIIDMEFYYDINNGLFMVEEGAEEGAVESIDITNPYTGESSYTRCRIICPNCGMECNYKFESSNYFPFSSFVHQCEHCEYWITESEWEEIK